MSENTDTPEDETSRLENVPWRRIGRIAGLIVLVAVVLPFVIYAVPQVVGADHSYVVLSGSMEPAMSPGDVVIVNSVAPAKIGKGDVITFGGPRPTTHRVIEVVNQEGTRAFRTKGDANEDADPQLVQPGEVKGKVMSAGGFLFVIPFIGHVIVFAGTQIGFVGLFVVPLVLLIASEIWNVIVSSDPDDADDEDTAGPAGSTDGAASESGEEIPAETDTDSGSDDSAITFSAAELQLGLVTLGAFLAYSIWVTYATFEIWAFGVTGGVATTFLLLSGLYLTGGGTDEDGTDDHDDESSPVSADPDESDTEGSVAGNETPPDVDVDGELDIVKRTETNQSVDIASGVAQAASGGGGGTDENGTQIGPDPAEFEGSQGSMAEAERGDPGNADQSAKGGSDD